MNELGGSRKSPNTALVKESTDKPGDLEGPVKKTFPKSSDEKVKKSMKKPEEDKGNSVKEEKAGNAFDSIFQKALKEDFDLGFGDEIESAGPDLDDDMGDGLDGDLDSEEGLTEEPTIEGVFDFLKKAFEMAQKLVGDEGSAGGEEDVSLDGELSDGDEFEAEGVVKEEGVDSENGENKGKSLTAKGSMALKGATPVSGGKEGSGEATGEEDGGKPKKAGEKEGHKLTKMSSIDTKGVKTGKELFNQ